MRLDDSRESGNVEDRRAGGPRIGGRGAIGGDRLQKQSQGYVVPDAFIRGSSAQRARGFKRGLESGSLKQCGTFAASAP